MVIQIIVVCVEATDAIGRQIRMGVLQIGYRIYYTNALNVYCAENINSCILHDFYLRLYPCFIEYAFKSFLVHLKRE